MHIGHLTEKHWKSILRWMLKRLYILQYLGFVPEVESSRYYEWESRLLLYFRFFLINRRLFSGPTTVPNEETK